MASRTQPQATSTTTSTAATATARTAQAPNITVETHLTGADRRAALASDVREGLRATPKQLPPKWFYDETGSVLFEKITMLAEYYPTRRERAVLHARAAQIASVTGADTLVELGSGTSEKTRLLLNALQAAGTLRRFVPFDVDVTVLTRAADVIGAEYPEIAVHAVVGDFERHLELLPAGGRRLVVFLGGTIGNLEPAPRHAFLTGVRARLAPGDALLLGADLVKDVGRLLRAYDDAAGVTAAFNRNVLSVVNRELGADFALRGFAHVAAWDPDAEWIEMRLRSVCDQLVRVRDLGIEVAFAAGEQMRTEVSAKFRRDGLEAELAAAGLAMTRFWTDPDDDFAVCLSTPA
jgi:L-histidine N-alpha-methyltransferase